VQSASRTMMVRQSEHDKITESFGLYALTGKATAFIAPLSIGWMTQVSDNQAIGITPIIALFLLGLVLLAWVNPDGRPPKEKTTDVFA
jgi:UMF1 family MFS transporter